MFRLTSLMLLLTAALSGFAADTYEFDTAHSSVMFNVEHNTVGMAFGRFNKYEGTADFDGDKLTNVKVTIDTASIDSGNEKRDGHLRKPDFFNAVEFAQITFQSTSVKVEAGKTMVTGDLTMVGTTKPVTFELSTKGPVDGRGEAKIRGIHGQAVIKRSDFGITYGMGGIGDDVTITIALEVVKE